MKKKFNLKSTILGIIIGGIVFGSIGIVATNYLLRAEDVEYVDKNNNSTTVQSAITDLYSKASSVSNGEILLGTIDKTHKSITIPYEGEYVSAYCLYGTNNSYNKEGIIKDGKCEITGLNVKTTYQYKIVASDSTGKIYEKIGEVETLGTPSTEYYSNPAVVYFNPVTNAKCTDYSEANSATGNSEGCMRWYAYKRYGTDYTLLLDHNVVAYSYYNYDNDKSKRGERSAGQLTNEKGTSISFNEIGYDLKQLVETSGWNSNLNIDLITLDDIKLITELDVPNYYFNGVALGVSPKQDKGTNPYKWLFDRTTSCETYGCDKNDNNTNGYWTSTALADSNGLWSVNSYGTVGASVARNLDGLRPVIEVPSSILNIS